MLKVVKQIDAIVEILSKHGPMSVTEITKEILEKRLAVMHSEDPKKSIAGCISRNPNRFKRIKPGVYDLKMRKDASRYTHSQHDTLSNQHVVSYSYWKIQRAPQMEDMRTEE